MIEIVIISIIAICVAIGVLVLRKTDPSLGEFQPQSLGNGEEKVENGKPNQEDNVSRGGIQIGRTPGTLPNSDYERVHESQMDSVIAKESQPPSTPLGDDHHHTSDDQLQSDSGESSLTFKTFDELGQYWLGQEYADTGSSIQTPNTLPNSGYKRAHGVQKQGASSRSRQTPQVKPSLPNDCDSRTIGNSGYYPLDPAIYVVGKPNIINHRSKRYARTKVTFWR